MAYPTGIRGRFFANLLEKALKFYERHQDSINSAISATAISLIESLIAELPAIVTALNPPGPQ
jgi:hypothetical protein